MSLQMERLKYVRNNIRMYNDIYFNRIFYRSFSKIILDKSIKMWYKTNNNKEAIWKKMK